MHTEMARAVQDICVRFALMRLGTVSSSLVDTALLASSAGHGNKLSIYSEVLFCVGFRSDGYEDVMKNAG